MSWEHVSYNAGLFGDLRVSKVISALARAYVNGAAKIACFVPTDNKAFDDAARTDLRGLDHLLSTFLSAPSVRSALLDIGIPDGTAAPPHGTMGAFEFEGALVQLLLRGGAYGGGVPSEDIARELARNFVDAVAGDRRLQVTVFSVDGAWTEWFHDVAWDHTFIVYDPTQRKWTCVFLTDTD